jgi:hypothetical protein
MSHMPAAVVDLCFVDQRSGQYRHRIYYLVVVWLYLTLAHAMLVFSLTLVHYGSSSRLQLSGYSLSASAFSLSVSTTILEFNSWTTNLKK